MTPLEFMARLVALIPPPRSPLVHVHGMFALRLRYSNYSGAPQAFII
jgi:hypothetical protein